MKILPIGCPIIPISRNQTEACGKFLSLHKIQSPAYLWVIVVVYLWLCLCLVLFTWYHDFCRVFPWSVGL